MSALTIVPESDFAHRPPSKPLHHMKKKRKRWTFVTELPDGTPIKPVVRAQGARAAKRAWNRAQIAKPKASSLSDTQRSFMRGDGIFARGPGNPVLTNDERAVWLRPLTPREAA